MKKKAWIGFDPDTSKSGFALLTSEGEWSLQAVELFKLKEAVLDTADQAGVFLKDIEAFVEAPRIDSASFGDVNLWKAKSIQFKNQGIGLKAAQEKALRLVLKIANKKGRCSQVGEEIIKIIDQLGIKTNRIKPSDRARFDGHVTNKVDCKEIKRLINSSKKYRYPSKLDATRFNALTGYHGRTNEEKRDAALLLVNKYINL